jgi:hypothetical protein
MKARGYTPSYPLKPSRVRERLAYTEAMESIRIVAALLLVLLPEPVFSWNIPGHMLF